MYGLRGYLYGLLNRKGTGYVATANTALEFEISEHCDGGHDHEQVFGGKRITEYAGQ